MARKNNKIVELLIERRMTDADMKFRNQPIKERMDRIGAMLNVFKQKWNVVQANNTNAQINFKDYDPQEFEPVDG